VAGRGWKHNETEKKTNGKKFQHCGAENVRETTAEANLSAQEIRTG